MMAIADNEPAQHAIAPEVLQQRLAEAAHYAVLCRIAPLLRHDVAGLMQPVGMLLMVLQRRIQMTTPDVEAISKNLASVSALTKDATTGCMNAMEWLVSGEDMPVSLRSGVTEAAKLLETEFAAAALEIINGISDEQVTVPQSFLRGVLMGALLAFCDQGTVGNTLQITLESGTGNTDTRDQLLLRMLPGDSATSPASTETNRQSRAIGWPDVEALAGSFNVTMARGEDWLMLSLPEPE